MNQPTKKLAAGSIISPETKNYKLTVKTNKTKDLTIITLPAALEGSASAVLRDESNNAEALAMEIADRDCEMGDSTPLPTPIKETGSLRAPNGKVYLSREYMESEEAVICWQDSEVYFPIKGLSTRVPDKCTLVI